MCPMHRGAQVRRGLLVLAAVLAAGVTGYAATPARADQVTQALAQVQAQRGVLHRAIHLLSKAERRHQHQIGSHRWFSGRLAQVVHLHGHAGLVRVNRIRSRIRYDERLLERYPHRRTRLRRDIRQARDQLHQLETRAHALILRQARAQARLADRALRQLKHHKLKMLMGNKLGVRAVRLALTRLGTPYVWGGASPRAGFDCSGLVMWAYGKLGISLPHFAASQAELGRRVSIKNLQPGDLVFFESPIGHVAMYVADGLLIEAPHSGDVVRITRLDDPWHVANFQGAVRIAPPTKTPAATAPASSSKS
jgi:hypothetical protein